MARSKRAQVLMEPDEYAQLSKLARQKKVSVGELIRSAVRECYFISRERRIAAAESLCHMEIPLDDWETLEREICEGRGDDLP